MKGQYDLAIVGAGPAGLAAAALAGELGLTTLLLDEQREPGGQVYRNIETTPPDRRRILGPDYARGEALAKALRGSTVDYVTGASVWRVQAGGEIGLSRNGVAHLISAATVILATGAIERPCPIPGWTLPGVMTAGAAQTLLKASGMVAEGAVFAGSGPLLYLIAGQYAAAGAMPRAVLDTTPRANYLRAARFLPEAIMAGSYLAKGLSLMADLRRRGVPIIKGAEALRATGNDSLKSIEYHRKGRWSSIDTEHLFLHQGVIPNLNLAHAAGCEITWDESQLCFRPVVDEWGASSVNGIYIAGDGVGIGGAVAAELRGRLSVLGASDRDRQAVSIRAALNKDLRIRRFLETLYRPRASFRVPDQDDVVVCRCEEVTLGQIRQAVAQGCPGPNQLKAFTRCGMGPCQGRQCGPIISEAMATMAGAAVDKMGYFRLRSPVKPVTLGELAALADDDSNL